MKKKVSVIMGIYNCEDTLSEAIESILAQTYDNWELIMCDDCSKDRTYEIAKKYEKKYPQKIKVLKNEKNLTLGPTLNRCLEIVTGDYIARQDGDDKSVNTRFEKQVEFLEKELKYSAVGSKMISFDHLTIKGIRGVEEGEGKRESLLISVPFCHASIMMRKEVYKELKGYRNLPHTFRVEDLDLWFRFFEKGYVGYNLKDALYMVRDDGSEYRRRNFKNYINDFKTRLEGYGKLNFKYHKYIFLSKPILAYLLPLNLIKIYQEKKKERTKL